eukprot:10407009-Ditylum_brightwellii.AAC.1
MALTVSSVGAACWADTAFSAGRRVRSTIWPYQRKILLQLVDDQLLAAVPLVTSPSLAPVGLQDRILSSHGGVGNIQ